MVEKYKCIALDEIGDATPALQAKILRLLQSGDYLKVGDTRFRKNEDLVFIAATNKGPDALRDDLLWRFKARIYVPPLAERRSDLVDLLYAIATHEGIKEITERCLGFLIEEHEWPGNAREMQFMLLQARERAADEPIDLLHLPVLFVPPELGGTRGRWSDASDPAPVWKFDDSFCARAKKHFDVEVIAGLSDEDVQHALQRLAYHASQNPREEPQHIFYREVPKALHELVAATRDRRDGACVNLESRLQQAKTWHEAANIARGIWYEARMKEGKTHKELAALLGITAQAFGQQRHKYGILSLRWPGRK